jgi:hypothetical protein
MMIVTIVSNACTINIINGASRNVNNASRDIVDDSGDTPNCGVTFTIAMKIVICL